MLDQRIDWFVSFSSAAAVGGSPGQVAYSTANAWLDGFAQWQQANGVPGSSINWGAWLEVGGAAENPNPLLDPITPAEGLDALEIVLASGRPWTTIWLLDWARALDVLPSLRDMTLFGPLNDRYSTADGDEGQWDGVEAIRSAEPSVGAAMLTARLVERVAAVDGVRPRGYDC